MVYIPNGGHVHHCCPLPAHTTHKNLPCQLKNTNKHKTYSNNYYKAP